MVLTMLRESCLLEYTSDGTNTSGGFYLLMFFFLTFLPSLLGLSFVFFQPGHNPGFTYASWYVHIKKAEL